MHACIDCPVWCWGGWRHSWALASRPAQQRPDQAGVASHAAEPHASKTCSSTASLPFHTLPWSNMNTTVPETAELPVPRGSDDGVSTKYVLPRLEARCEKRSMDFVSAVPVCSRTYPHQAQGHALAHALPPCNMLCDIQGPRVWYVCWTHDFSWLACAKAAKVPGAWSAS